jgi:hypothetical protein
MWQRLKDAILPDQIEIRLSAYNVIGLLVAVAVLWQAGLSWIVLAGACIVGIIVCVGLLFGNFRSKDMGD